MLPKPALLSSIEVPEPALSLSSAGLALLRVLAVSMYFIGTIPDNGTTQPALYRPPHCMLLECAINSHDECWQCLHLTNILLLGYEEVRSQNTHSDGVWAPLLIKCYHRQ